MPDILTIEGEAGREPWTADRALGVLDHPCGQAWLQLDDAGRPVGHLLALVVADEAEILTIAVRPLRQREGRGSALLDAVLTTWASRGVARVVLEVRVDNTAARALYARHGFAKVGERPAYYADGTDAEVLARDLTPDPTS